MSVSVVPYLIAAAAIAGIGAHAVIARPHLIHKILAINVMGSAAFLVLIAVARRAPGDAPDPVPHAMVLTGIVVAVCATAFTLILLRRIHDHTGEMALPEDADDMVRELSSTQDTGDRDSR